MLIHCELCLDNRTHAWYYPHGPLAIPDVAYQLEQMVLPAGTRADT